MCNEGAVTPRSRLEIAALVRYGLPSSSWDIPRASRNSRIRRATTADRRAAFGTGVRRRVVRTGEV